MKISPKQNKQRTKVIKASMIITLMILSFSTIANQFNSNEFNYGDQNAYQDHDEIYNDPQSYKNYDFYLKSDPAKWDLNKVDWSLQEVYQNPNLYERTEIFSRQEIYQNTEFYKNLPSEGYNKLNYTKVNYEDNNLNQEQINAQKFLTDFACYQCTLNNDQSTSKKTKLRFENGKITLVSTQNTLPGTSQKQDTVSIPSGFPPATTFSVINDRILVTIPPSGKTIDLNNLDSKGHFTFDTTFQNRNQYNQNNNEPTPQLRLPPIENTFTVGDLPISGKITFDNAQPYVKKGDEATIAGITISTTGYETEVEPSIQTKGVNIYTDGEKHTEDTGDYFSLDKTKGRLTIHKDDQNRHQPDDKFPNGKPETFHITFDNTNPIFQVKGRDRLEMDIGTGTTAVIQKRKGLIPIITATMPSKEEGGSFVVYNGRNIASINQKREGGRYDLLTRADRTRNRATSVPLTLIPQNEKGGNLFPNKNEEGPFGLKLIMDNINFGQILPTTAKATEWECNSCTKDLKKTILTFIQQHQDRSQSIPTQAPSFEQNVVQIHQAMDSLPIALQAAVKDIIIYPDTEEGRKNLQKFCEGENALACEHKRELHIPATVLTDTSGGLDEGSKETLAHEATHALEEALQDEDEKKSSKLWGKTTFKDTWLGIAKDDQGNSPYNNENDNIHSTIDAERDCKKSLGIVSCYGQENWHEDVSTHAECGRKRECWEKQVTKESPSYNLQDVAKYHIMCNNGFFHDNTCEDMAEINPLIRSVNK